MKKALSIIKKVLVWLVILVAVFMMIFTIVSVRNFDRNDRDIFGFKMFIVQTDSMKATHFDAGDLIFVKEVDPITLKEGDIITYTSQNEHNYGETVTHMIRRKTVDAEGNYGFITYGTTTGVDDETVVTFPYIAGKYVGKIPNAGHFFNFLKTPQGYIICIFIPFMLLIIYQGVNCIKLFRRYKKEQTEALEAERAEIEAERAKNQKMMDELMALKAQMAANAEKAEEKTEEVTEEKAEEAATVEATAEEATEDKAEDPDKKAE